MGGFQLPLLYTILSNFIRTGRKALARILHLKVEVLQQVLVELRFCFQINKYRITGIVSWYVSHHDCGMIIRN